MFLFIQNIKIHISQIYISIKIVSIDILDHESWVSVRNLVLVSQDEG